MSASRPRKKRVDQINRAKLVEPTLSPEEQEVFNEGITLFNKGKFWHAHESWERVWLRRSEESRLFYQGLIQAAAGYHLAVERPRISGAIRNLEKSLDKLDLFPQRFLGIDVGELMNLMREAIKSLRTTRVTGEGFPRELIPVLGRVKRD